MKSCFAVQSNILPLKLPRRKTTIGRLHKTKARMKLRLRLLRTLYLVWKLLAFIKEIISQWLVERDKIKDEKLYCSSNDLTSDFCEMRLSPDLFSSLKLGIYVTTERSQPLFFYRPFTFPKAFHIHREIRCSKNTTKVQSYVAIGGRQVNVATINTCSCNWE